MEKVYYYEGDGAVHSFTYPFNKEYIYKIHIIASTRSSSSDPSPTTINYLCSSSSLFNGSYLSFTVSDNNVSSISSYNNTSSFYINDSYSNTVNPSYATTKLIDFEISPTFESGVLSTYQWVAYGTSVCSVSDQANAPITLTHFAHSIDGTLGGLKIDSGLDIGTYDPFAVTVYRIKRRQIIMAIIKDLNTNFGCSAEYHRITSININYKVKKVIICVASYLTKEARINRYNPMEAIDIEVPYEDFNLFLDSNVINIAYIWLKNNVVVFDDSIDCFDKILDTDLEEDKY